MRDSMVPGIVDSISSGADDNDPISSVARDFVEAPSQMLENWCWEPKVLEKMSSHYETKQPLSADLIDKIIKRYVLSSLYRAKVLIRFWSRYVNVGLFYLRQLFFAKFDLKVHTDQSVYLPSNLYQLLWLNILSEKENYTELWNTLRQKVSLVNYEKACPGQGTFGHITGGYDAGYYGFDS